MTAPANFGTPSRIIRMAMENAGLLSEGDEPSSGQLAKYMQRLNDLINLWQTQGLKLFLWQDLPIPLVSGQGTYTIGESGLSDVVMAKPLRVMQAYFDDTDSNRTHLTALSWDAYLRIVQGTSTGAVTSYFVDKQKDQLKVSLWKIPDDTAATGTLHALVQTQATHLISLTDSMVFPPEWYAPLHWGLADEISTGQPASVIARCQQKATMYRNALEDWDVEDVDVRFEANVQGSPNNFR